VPERQSNDERQLPLYQRDQSFREPQSLVELALLGFLVLIFVTDVYLLQRSQAWPEEEMFLVHDGSGHEIQRVPADAVKFGKHHYWCRDML
jgi:hypothetical protein